MRTLLIASLLALTGAPALAATPEAEVVQAAEDIMSAFNAVDGAAFARLTAPDFVTVDEAPPFLFAGPGALMRWGSTAMADARASGRTDSRCRIGPELQNRVTGDRAYYVTRVECTARLKGAPTVQTGVMTFVFARSAGVWRANFIAFSGEALHPAVPVR